MNTKELLERYSKSWFDEFVPAERVLTPGQKQAAEREYERDPVKCLMENVQDARDAVDGTKMRFMRARQDGLFDADWYRNSDRQDRKTWATAIDTIRGDYVRACSELEHWRGYVRWATEEQEAKVARLEAMQPDRRLPPEADDDGAVGDRAPGVLA